MIDFSWLKRNVTIAIEKVVPQSFADRLIRHYSIPNVDWSLRNARKNGFHPDIIVDVGAFEGEWSNMAHQIFPDSQILAVEPQLEKENHLKNLSRTCEKIQYRIELLGAEAKQKVTFRLNETASSILLPEGEEGRNSEVRTLTTLDALVEESIFAKPDLLKLDVQGYELEVLRGGERTLRSHPPELILMEISLLQVIPDAPLFTDVIQFMDDLGYRLYDLCSFIRRPYDDALWQVDGLFAHKASDLVASDQWG